jgi:hypothetical protein
VIASVSDATLITGIVVLFFALLALLAFGRAIFRRDPPAARRFRIGVFVERDHERADGDGDRDEQ